MRVKAKFVVEHVTKYPHGEQVKLVAVYEGATQNQTEDKHFAEASPSGSLEIYISNPEVHGHFQPGDAHYITFEKAE